MDKEIIDSMTSEQLVIEFEERIKNGENAVELRDEILSRMRTDDVKREWESK